MTIKVDTMTRVDASTPFFLGEWRVEAALGRISRDDEIVKIDPRNMEVLLLLATRPGQVVSQIEIEKAVWSDVVVTSSSVYQSIAQLRRALGDDKNQPRYIETISRKGYRLLAHPVFEPKLPSTSAAVPVPHPVVERHKWLISMGVSVAVLIMGATIVVLVSNGRTERLQVQSEIPESPFIDLTATKPTAYSRVRLDRAAADVAVREGRPEEALRYLERAIATQRSGVSDTHPFLAQLTIELAHVHHWLGDYAAAEAAAREAMAINERSAPANSPYRLEPEIVLADVLLDLERYDEAERHTLKAIELARSLHGDSGDYMESALSTLATLRMEQGRLDEAERALRETIRLASLGFGKDSTNVTGARTALAVVQLKADRVDDAVAEGRASLAALKQTVRSNHPFVASAQHVLGEALCRRGEFGEAEQLLLSEIEIWKDSNAPDWRVARAVSALGEAVLGQGRVHEAARHLSFASEQLENLRGRQQADARRATQERLQLLERVRQGVPLLAARSLNAQETPRGFREDAVSH